MSGAHWSKFAKAKRRQAPPAPEPAKVLSKAEIDELLTERPDLQSFGSRAYARSRERNPPQD